MLLSENQATDSSVALSELSVGSRGIVVGFKGESDLHYRLQEMGLVPQTEVFIKRLAPLGDPMEIVLRGYSLSIRKADAAEILVVPQPHG